MPESIKQLIENDDIMHLIRREMQSLAISGKIKSDEYQDLFDLLGYRLNQLKKRNIK